MKERQKKLKALCKQYCELENEIGNIGFQINEYISPRVNVISIDLGVLLKGVEDKYGIRIVGLRYERGKENIIPPNLGIEWKLK